VSTTFRLALAPSIVNPRVGRLWLIPSVSPPKSTMSNFGAIASEMRELSEQVVRSAGRLDLVAMTTKQKEFSKILEVMGSAVVRFPTGKAATFHFDISGNTDHHLKAIELFSRAGARIPNRVRVKISSAQATNAFAWWMALIVRFSKVEPTPWRYQPDDPQHGRVWKLGWYWEDPLSASLSAMEAADLLPPDARPLDGDWTTIPISEAEFARRMLPNKKSARGRDVKTLLAKYEKHSVGKKWIFRLDTLPAATRKKLED
jgi:hypothetical protein